MIKYGELIGILFNFLKIYFLIYVQYDAVCRDINYFYLTNKQINI